MVSQGALLGKPGQGELAGMKTVELKVISEGVPGIKVKLKANHKEKYERLTSPRSQC